MLHIVLIDLSVTQKVRPVYGFIKYRRRLLYIQQSQTSIRPEWFVKDCVDGTTQMLFLLWENYNMIFVIDKMVAGQTLTKSPSYKTTC